MELVYRESHSAHCFFALEEKLIRLARRCSTFFQTDTLSYDVRGQTVRVGTHASVQENAYAGLGTLRRSTTWERGAGLSQETHVQDALANTVRSDHLGDLNTTNPGTRELRFYESETSRLLASALVDGSGNQIAGSVEGQTYDAAGNQTYAYAFRLGYGGYAPWGSSFESRTASYYDAEGRLRVVDRRSCAWVDYPGTGLTCEAAKDGEVAAFEEMRYDPLGRRVLVRTDQSWACLQNCVNGATRTVWDGDRVLWEIRAPATAPEQDTGAVVSPSRGLYGRVGYVFGGALDHPLSLHRYAHGDTLFARHASGTQQGVSVEPVVIYPHANWRGAPSRAEGRGSPTTPGRAGRLRGERSASSRLASEPPAS